MASDDELVASCLEAKQAAAEAFDELYRRHASQVLGLVNGLVRGDEHAARDALQETFLRFYTALPSFDRGRPVRPWLLRIARNVCFDHLKRRRNRDEVPTAPERLPERGETRTPADVAAGREATALLRGAVLDLPPEELAVFLLKHDLGHTYEQVADVLSCSVRTAKYRMKAALERLGREAERLGVEA